MGQFPCSPVRPYTVVPDGSVQGYSPEPPTPSAAIPDKLHGGQVRIRICPEPDLHLPDLYVHASTARRHSTLLAPPVGPFKPPDRRRRYLPFMRSPNDALRQAVWRRPHDHVLHDAHSRGRVRQEVRTACKEPPVMRWKQKTAVPALGRNSGLVLIHWVGPTGIEPMTSTV